MVYLTHFSFPSLEEEYTFHFQLKRTCYDTLYPFGILSKRHLECLDFDPVTILYGGNGSGKTTALNVMAEKLGLPRISWLGDVKYVRWAIILVVVWSMVSYYVIIMLAAMQGVDSSYYEAARLDGASSRQVFFKITLPMLTPMIFFSVIMVTIGILQIFDFIYLMVDRQTLSYTYSMSLVTYFYECAFNKSSMRGYGAAISVVLAAIIMVITIIQMIGKKYWVRSGE